MGGRAHGNVADAACGREALSGPTVAADPAGCSTAAGRTDRSRTAAARSGCSRVPRGPRPESRSSWGPAAHSTCPRGCSRVGKGVGLESGRMAAGGGNISISVGLNM